MTSTAEAGTRKGSRLLGALLNAVDPARMSRQDAARWKSARSMADLGELVIAWLNGEITRTPDHCGPPDDETGPLIPALTAVNRGGFVTGNSQLAETHEGRSWNTWVSGFASDATLHVLRQAAEGTSLALTACRGRPHGCRKRFRFQPCPRRDVASFWADACPGAAGDIWGAWWVHIEDPQPGRNDLLWPALTDALTRRR